MGKAEAMSIESLLKLLKRKDADIASLTDEQSRLARHLVEQHDAIARLTWERDSATQSALRFAEQRDALLAACEGIASFGCINSSRVPTGTTCGKCDPCTARAAIEKVGKS